MTLEGRQLFLAQAAIVALVGVLLALTGAFGTGEMPLSFRFLYWIGGLMLAGLVLEGLVRLMRPVAHLLRLPQHMSYLFALPLLAVLVFLTLDALQPGIGALPASLYLQIFGLGVGLFALFGAVFWWSGRKRDVAASAKRSAEAGNADRPGITDSALHARLEPGFGPVVALAVEDHYVTVYGHERKAMLLMNLADAIAESGPGLGVRVHRSWWVARAAVRDTRKIGRNLRAVLANGTEAPVSRANVAEIRALLARQGRTAR